MKQIIRPLTPQAKARALGVRPSHSRFDSPWGATLELLEREVRNLGANEYVLQVDVAESDLRLDGQIRATAKPSSDVVAVAFDSKSGPLFFVCGSFIGWQQNVRAIALGLESLRRVDRYGITRTDEQYRGFAALPAAAPSGFGTVEDAARFLIEKGGMSTYSTHDLINSPVVAAQAYKRAARATHPDIGGNAETFMLVQSAKEMLGVS